MNNQELNERAGFISAAIAINMAPEDETIKKIKELYESKSEDAFIKLDNGKLRLSLLEPHFILSVGDVITFGAQKYAPNNWRLCEDTSRYKDALLRHIYAYLSGERYDPETKLSHLAHVACNCMFLQWFDEKDNNVHAE